MRRGSGGSYTARANETGHQVKVRFVGTPERIVPKDINPEREIFCENLT